MNFLRPQLDSIQKKKKRNATTRYKRLVDIFDLQETLNMRS